MRLISIQTSKFRNLSGERLELEDGINVLYGQNASGKTNTLECAYVFASGKSFRTRHESELIQNGRDTAKADIEFESGGRKADMSVVWHNSREIGYVKRMLYRGNEVPKASEFLGNFRAVLFTPDHLSLIKSGPEERRRFMDIALSQMQPRYIYYLNAYLKTLSQKNAYLKKASFTGNADFDYIEVLNTQLAKTAAVLIKQRSGFAEELRKYSCGIYRDLSASKENIDVKYLSLIKQNYSDAEYTESKLAEVFRADMQSEVKQGRALHGPHKDDMAFYISKNGEENEISGGMCDEDAEDGMRISEFAARTFGSQGQQRSAVLAIKLAEGEIFKDITGEYPMFLLDDLLGELDTRRQKALISLIKDKQTLISCCDKAALKNTERVNFVKVDSGKYFPDNAKTEDCFEE